MAIKFALALGDATVSVAGHHPAWLLTYDSREAASQRGGRTESKEVDCKMDIWMGWPSSTTQRDDDIINFEEEQGWRMKSKKGKRTAALNHKVWDDPMDD